jgi:hypothetical protein
MSVVNNSVVQKNSGTSLIARLHAREERELSALTARQLNELAACYLSYQVLAPDGNLDAVLVRRPDGEEFTFDPMNRLA